METSLHRQLKEHYAEADDELEAPLGPYRIDVRQPHRLIEIQHGSLAAIRDKVSALLAADHELLVVKPIVARKRIIMRSKRGGRVLRSRWSPKRGELLSLFDELVYWTRVFPHRRLVLEAPLVEIEEQRRPGHGRRRRRRASDFIIEDQRLSGIQSVHRFATASDLAALAPAGLPRPFHTGHLAERMGVARHIAQRIAYCFRHMDVVREVGKQGNARLYEFAVSRRPRRRAA